MSKFKSPLVAAAALGLFAVSAPALAGTGEPVRHYQAKTVETGGEPLYCVKETVAGSMIPQRVCMTKRGWTEAGARVVEKDVEVLAVNATKYPRR
ncbi:MULTISPECIES: hypothetical protein [Sphingobium]|uniref:Secreted protein n=1 Tax=Sphingobium lignivorans TaxID=2735886 RepID=A0ABR6NA65_9SPHN|nr:MULTISPECIES: hypothetical protein [Sphingobium]MBB5984166.1 hypothetical protein [Sphingobium lignivorans]BAK64851.1 hypothetical protein SLG_01760 [Sphingobium sp. SYK-6]